MKTTRYFEEQVLWKRPYMKFHYYPETDSLYIELSDQPSVESHEIKPGVVLDFSEEGHLVGLDLDHASRFINLAKVEMDSLPLRTLAFA